MHWVSLISRILGFLACGFALGWYFGYPWLGGTTSMLMILLLWCYQIWRLQLWLQSPDELPAGIYGVWGEIISKIHKHRREEGAARKHLQSTVDYLLESFASLRDGVVLVERGGGIRWCNEAATHLLGLRFPQDTGQALTNLVRYPDFTNYIHAEDFSEPLYFETGSELPMSLQVIVTRFGDGDRLIFARDITDRVRTENMRRDLVGNMSHELRTPLTVITGYLATLLDDVDRLPSGYVKPMRQMQQQAQRMENLLADLLWLSRIESEEREEKHDTVDLSALLEELREELSVSYAGRLIDLKLQDGIKIYGDYRQLYSAVSNLAVNAIKYSAPDSPITVRLHDLGDEIVLSVEDKGMGIGERDIPRLTERFYRVDDGRSTADGGTGLGLAIVKHVAVSHGARLEIESSLGAGSTFNLLFPSVS